ncbi:DNA excision repair protein ERCC-6-like [Brachyhypopomus gauderio]|uniref:DNA excision repair protein ERCC-6-like n=1 Tax=Brachyhypopomus gauderio TaxID=698409 RepID=UPI00404122CC
METLSDRLNRSLNINADDLEKYHRYRREGKEAAQQGELQRSLELFRLAFDLHPSAKLENRIQRLQEAIQELAASREEEEEEEDEAFVNVNNSGLMLYKDLYDKLYEHQKEGVAFLYSLHRDGRKGGILADDMGLGKTIQVISFLSGMYDAELANHTLLVMPTSLIKNWVQEFTKWTPGMRVKEFHGTSKAERNRNLERVQRKGGVAITTYQMLINNWEQLASSAGQEFVWDYVILDEAHKIKTSSTKTAKSAHAIPARQRLLLTGTPVQNNLREMWALFDFACKGSLLGTAKTFKAEYENPITRAREKDATPGEKALGLKISQNLMELIKPYFLRRTKAEVQNKKRVMEKGGDEEEDLENKCPNAGERTEMPSLTRKNDLIVWTYLSPIQEDIYNQFISLDHIKQLLTTTRSPLAELTVLKKLCDHPRLLSNRAVIQLGLEQGSAPNPALLEEEDEEQQSESAAGKIDHVSDETLVEESGKLRFLVSLLERLRADGHRTLVFSQSRKMLDITERVLRNRSFRLLRVDGTVTQLAERDRRITLFQTDRRYSVFLLTTQVGGVGLTLTAANRVVIFDPSWNPATDAQAVDRAYRIGQTENVVIYRLITCGTVEEKIYRRQVFKDSLIRQTTGDKKNPFRYFSKQELKELFTLEDTRCSSTQQQLQSLHGQHRRSDPSLDRHIACLHTMEMFGISDHDLLFSREAAADAPQDAESHHYIETRVQKAQELVRAESELHGQLRESVARDTEPAWIALARQRERAEMPARERGTPEPRSPPSVVDLTQSGSNDLLQSEEDQGTHCDSEVEIVGEDGSTEARDESVLSAGAIELSSQLVEENVAAESSRVSGHGLTIGDSLDLMEESFSEDLEEQQPDQRSLAQMKNLSLHPESRESSAVLATGANSQLLPQHPSLLGQLESSKALLGAELDASSTSVEEELDASVTSVEVEPFQGNFNLQLDDSVEMFADEGEEEAEPSAEGEEAEPSAEEEGFPMRMEESDSGQDRAGEAGNTSPCDSPLRMQTAASTPAGDSFLCLGSRKKRAQVIYDSEEDEQEEKQMEKPCLASSPLASNFRSSSTPKSILTNSTPRRRSVNTSVASRRSFVESLLEDLEEEETEEEEDCSSEGAGLSQASEANGTSVDESVEEEEGCGSGGVCPSQASEDNGTSVDESVEEEEGCGSGGVCPSQASEDNGTSVDESVEEEEVNGETLSSENTGECQGVTSEEHESEEEDEGEESTGDVELASNEAMDQFAPVPTPETCLQLASQSESTVRVPERPEDTYESLVFSGKCYLTQGKKQQALDVFLKAIDINNGDGEIQLLIIQLYRELSQPRS